MFVFNVYTNICNFLRQKFSYIKRSRSLRLVGTISSVALAILGVLAVSPVVDQPESVEAAGIASVTSIDIVSNRTSAKVRIKPINENGTFATSTGNDNIASFDVKTNNYTGYVLKLKANGASGELVNSNSNDSISSISTPAEASTFIADVTGAYTNKWGIKPSVVNGISNSYYLPAPVNNEEVLMETTTEANPTTGKNYEIGIGAKVDYTKVIGEYTNTYTAVAVGNPATYTINYSLGSITGVSGTVPSPTTGSATSSSSTTATVTLASSSLSRTGYDFAGWCYGTLGGTAANPGTTCNGTLVTNRTLNLDLNQTINNVATVYATWTTKSYTVSITAGGTTVSPTSLSIPFNNSKTFTVSPGTGYYLSSVTCPTGYTCSGYTTGDNATGQGQQTVTVKNNGASNSATGGTVTVARALRKFSLTFTFAGHATGVTVRSGSCTGTSMGSATTSSRTVTGLSYGTTYYLCSPTFDTGYQFSSWARTDSISGAEIGSTTASNTTYKVGLGNGAVTLTGKAINYTVSITAGGTTVSPTSLSIPFNNSKTFTVTPGTGYYLSSVTCPTGYTCSGYTTGDNATGQGQQTVTVKNNGTTAGGTVTVAQAKANYTLTITIDNGNGQNLKIEKPAKNSQGEYKYTKHYGETQEIIGSYSWGTWDAFYEKKSDNTLTKLSAGASGTAGPRNTRQARTYTVTMPPRNITIVLKGNCTKTSATPSMQSLNTSTYTSAYCPITVKDTRDSHTYTAAFLNKWMMTQDLTIGCENGSKIAKNQGVTLGSGNSNITSGTYVLDGNLGSLQNGATYMDGKYSCGTNTAWYNYVAATAGKITNSPNSSNNTQSICPKGWELPNNSDMNILAEDYMATGEVNPVAHGIYSVDNNLDGRLYTTKAYYWGSGKGTTDPGYNRTNFIFNDAGNNGTTVQSQNRQNGLNIRCIKQD